jgi:hypothetical protein
MMHKAKLWLPVLAACLISNVRAQVTVSDEPQNGSVELISSGHSSAICIDPGDFELIKKSAGWLQQDIEMVTGKKLAIRHQVPASSSSIVIIGTIERSSLIRQLLGRKKINVDRIKNKWDAYSIQTVSNPFKGIKNAIVIIGSNKRGAAYGTLELSKQAGVSPWYWWADVPVKKKKALYVNSASFSDAPKVKYRGIFINDEAPAMSGWTREKFGGFNHLMYEKMFELILRLKGNYLWPAMWGNAFYDDDTLNIKSADEYGIVIGTSHHEPLMRAHDEWRRYGKGKWDYDSNEVRLKEFWRGGMQRAWNEKIVSVGMRGDGDRPMSRETATALLERIVKDQRQIIEEVTGKPASQTPQLWALYKEVQDYYDKGMRVPDDVTLLLCDDNWGNIRKLPKPNDKPRSGGYGIYYHFDYVGGPRNYKWLNTNPIARVWEQMHLAYEHGVRQIWIVNVGDLKPMEFPISFWLDYAWDPDKIGAADLQKYTEQWASHQFGSKHATEIASIISRYTKYNGRRKPELLDANTYSLLSYGESNRVKKEWYDLLTQAEKINNELPAEYRDAYYQLVLHPVRACANLHEMYNAVAWNRYEAARKSPAANPAAEAVKRLYNKDSLITLQYHSIANGKWNHMMDQTHIGYTYWQQPPRQKMPEVKYVPQDSVVEPPPEQEMLLQSARDQVPKDIKGNVFYEESGYVSIGADHFTRNVNTNGINWTVLPDHGKTGSAITAFPVTAAPQKAGGTSPHLQYDVYVYDTGSIKLSAYFSPTLNFHNTDVGLQYAISIDDENPRILSINSEDRNTGAGIWNAWVANNIIVKTTNHRVATPGRHTVKYWMVHPGVVLQKLVLDFGGVEPSYLGPPETMFSQNNF